MWDNLLAQAPTPLILGHRGMGTSVGGGVSRYIENSMESVLKAASIGCDGVEVDVYLTGDDQLAVIHGSSDTGDMDFNVRGRSGPIEDFSGDLADLPLKLPESVTDYEHLAQPSCTVPSLGDMLDGISREVSSRPYFLVNLELKGTKRRLSSEVLRLLTNRNMFFLISSFNYEFSGVDESLGVYRAPVDNLADLADNGLGVPLGLLVDYTEGLSLSLGLCVEHMKRYRARWMIFDQRCLVACPVTGESVQVSSVGVKAFISEIHALGYYVGVYMPGPRDDEAVIRACCVNGLDMLIVNEAFKALEIRGEVLGHK